MEGCKIRGLFSVTVSRNGLKGTKPIFKEIYNWSTGKIHTIYAILVKMVQDRGHFWVFRSFLLKFLHFYGPSLSLSLSLSDRKVKSSFFLG